MYTIYFVFLAIKMPGVKFIVPENKIDMASQGIAEDESI